MSSMRYVIISPVRNEAEYIRATVASVAAQTIRPARWVIVDDGSSDATPSLIDEAARQHDWITATHRQDRGRRLAGSGVMQAFFAGLARLDTSSWQFLVKLDGDVTFDSDYFERCFARFAAEPRLGIAGGLICNRVGGQVCAEAADDPAFHVRGATKIYRRECWEAIGGLQPATGWDTVDELKANMLGWVTRTFPEIKILHHRPAGAAYGTWSNWVKNGAANYFAGYHPLFMLAKCGRRYRCYGLETVCLRYFNIFGPRQDPSSPYSGVLAKFITQMLRGEQPTIFGDGSQSRDFTYIDNAVEANLLACKAPAEQAAGRVFNIATGRRVDLNETFLTLKQIIGYKGEVKHAPERAGDIKHSLADMSRAEKHLGYKPKVDFEEGLRRTIEWYRKSL